MQDFILHIGVATIQLAWQEIISEMVSAGFGKANFIKGNTSVGARESACVGQQTITKSHINVF